MTDILPRVIEFLKSQTYLAAVAAAFEGWARWVGGNIGFDLVLRGLKALLNISISSLELAIRMMRWFVTLLP